MAPPEVHRVIGSAGMALDPASRAPAEQRLGHDLSKVRIHADAAAAESARAVNALAYTVGDHVVFGAGKYAPGTSDGMALLAHELTHVAQQNASSTAPSPDLRIGAPDDPREIQAAEVAEGVSLERPEQLLADASRQIRRVAARLTSCGGGALHVAGPPPVNIADPVGIISAAETRARGMILAAIEELDADRRAIIAGRGEPAWPTVSEAMAQGLRVLGLNPDSRAFWTGSGPHTAGLLLRRLRLIANIVGTNSVFFVCLGPAHGTIGACSGPICDGGAEARSCAGTFRIDLCPPFWTDDSAEEQAGAIVHEASHIFASFVQEGGEREGRAECYGRFVQIVSGVPEAEQRLDLCSNP